MVIGSEPWRTEPFVPLWHSAKVASHACSLRTSGRHRRRPWYENLIPARLEAQLEAQVGGAEMAHLINHGQQLTVAALVSEVLRALDELSA